MNNKLINHLQQTLNKAVESGEESGCQLAIFKGGELIVNIAAGKNIDKESLFPVFSVGKGIMTTAFHRLVEKGIIDYDTSVADVWPEFGCNGKEDTLVWHVLSHRAGLFQLPLSLEYDDLTDWNTMCKLIAQMPPEYKPGTKCHYHALTYAWLLGEIAHRADGRDFKKIISEEVLEPLGISDKFFFGTTDEAEKDFVRLDASGIPALKDWRMDFMHNENIRRGFIPSANGVANAYSIAKHYAALLGEVDGIRLLKSETIANATILRRSADDPVKPGDWAKFGLGYALCGPDNNLGSMFGHGGAAGAEGFVDKKSGLAVGFTKNKLNTTHPFHTTRDQISEALGLPPRHW